MKLLKNLFKKKTNIETFQELIDSRGDIPQNEAIEIAMSCILNQRSQIESYGSINNKSKGVEKLRNSSIILREQKKDKYGFSKMLFSISILSDDFIIVCDCDKNNEYRNKVPHIIYMKLCDMFDKEFKNRGKSTTFNWNTMNFTIEDKNKKTEYKTGW